MNVQQILSMTTTKTEKIKLLHQLGYSINEIAQMVGSNTGFVYVVINYRSGQQNRTRITQTANTQFIITDFNRKFGIEIEAFNVERCYLAEKLREAGIVVEIEGYNHSTRNHWKIVSDSSIRGEKSFELVSPPLTGLEGLKEVEVVCKVLKKANAKINKTCGFHVHIDAHNFKLKQWKNIYKNYITFENAIDSFQPISRRGNTNTYCKGFSAKTREALFNGIDKATTVMAISKNVTGYSSSSARYFKINAQAFKRHGTIEFRQHSGTIEFLKISNWITFLHNLITYSENHVADSGEFEKLSDFNQIEVMAYLNERVQELN